MILSASRRIFSLAALLLALTPFAQQLPPELLHHWDYDRSAPLNLKQTGVQDRDGVKVYDISYAAPVGDRNHVGLRRVTAVLWARPKPKGATENSPAWFAFLLGAGCPTCRVCTWVFVV